MHIYDCLHNVEYALGNETPWLDRAPKFVLSNVAAFYYDHPKEIWSLKDFPYPHPPFDSLWFEYELPRSFLLRAVEAPGPSDSPINSTERSDMRYVAENSRLFFVGVCARNHDFPNIKKDWFIRGTLCYFPATGQNRHLAYKVDNPQDFFFSLDPADGLVHSGIIKYSLKKSDPRNLDPHDFLHAFHPVLMAFSFANCRNIEIIKVEPSAALNRARLKKGKPAFHPHHLINILPFGKVFARSTRSVSLGADQKLDIAIRRGNFARYGPLYNRGLLFGKYSGIFWRPAINFKPELNTEYNIKVAK